VFHIVPGPKEFAKGDRVMLIGHTERGHGTVIKVTATLVRVKWMKAPTSGQTFTKAKARANLRVV
jgi:endonuclease V-like protein UPF0215 family